MKITAAPLLIAAVFLFSGQGCRQKKLTPPDTKKIEIRGIYGSPNAFWNKGVSLSELNVNSVFVNWKAINEKIMERAGEEGLKVFAEFPVLNGKGYVGSGKTLNGSATGFRLSPGNSPKSGR